MRLTLLCASSVLAASLLLSACSSGTGSQAIPGGTQVTAPMGQGAGGYRVSTEGIQPNTSACPSSLYVKCIILTPGKTVKDQWCISNSGNCNSGLYPGTVKWTIPMKPYVVKTKALFPKITASWSPVKGNPSNLKVTTAAGVKPSKGIVKYALGWKACLLTGSSKGTCFGPEIEGFIIK